MRVLLDRLRHDGLALVVLGIGELPIAERVRHRDDVAGVVFVVVAAVGHREALRGILVAGQQRVDVIDALLRVAGEGQRIEDEQREAALVGAGLGQHREVRRRLAAIGRGRRLVVGEGRREAIGRTGRTLLLGTGIVDFLDAVGLGERLDLPRGEARTAGLREVAEGDQTHGVAARADFLVDLEAALELRLVEPAEHAGKAPLLPRRIDAVAVIGERRGGTEGGREKSRGGEACDAHRCCLPLPVSAWPVRPRRPRACPIRSPACPCRSRFRGSIPAGGRASRTGRRGA